ARLWEVTRIVAESYMAFCVKVAHSAVSMCRFPELRRLRLAASMIEERSLGDIWTVILLVMDSWQSKCEARHQRRLSNRHCLVYSKTLRRGRKESILDLATCMMRLRAFGRRNRFGEILLSPDGQQIKRQ